MRPYIETYGNWEPEEGHLLLRLGRPEMVFLDIGASFGYFSRLIAKSFPTARVEAFEPHPVMAHLLTLNTWEFGERVTVWRTALGSARGTVGMTVAEHNIGDSRTYSDDGSYEIVSPVSRLDDLIRGRVDLVKMDVQGFETDVMVGMSRLWRENPGMKIVTEFWPTAITERRMRPADVLSRYRSLGFEISLLRDEVGVEAEDDEIILYSTSAGADGQATLILSRAAS